MIFLCKLLNHPEAKASAAICLGSEKWQKRMSNRFRIESFPVVEERHSHSRATAVSPLPRWRNPQLYGSVFENGIERVRHQVRQYLTNLALASQQNGAVADLG